MAQAVSDNEDVQRLDLVICEDDFLFDNRWFHTESTQDSSNAVKYDTDLVVRNEQIFTRLPAFSQLRRAKVIRITFGQLKQFERLPCLEHLEIVNFLAEEYSSCIFWKETIKLPALKRLLIGSLSGPNSVLKRIYKFETNALEAVYLGMN